MKVTDAKPVPNKQSLCIYIIYIYPVCTYKYIYYLMSMEPTWTMKNAYYDRWHFQGSITFIIIPPIYKISEKNYNKTQIYHVKIVQGDINSGFYHFYKFNFVYFNSQSTQYQE